jgi:hypothetical protein
MRNVPSSHRVLLTTVALLLPVPASSQMFRGQVVEEGGDRGVPTALVRLMDVGGGQVAFTLADGGGAYVLEAPGPGEYRLVAERLGYEPFRTPLLEVGDPAGVYPVDLAMRRAPLPIRGLTVFADRLAAIEREVRLDIGVSPRSLRVAPIGRAGIEEHLAKGHQLEDLVRWSNLPGVVVKRTTEGPCFQVRGRGCLPVFLNRMRLAPELVETVPLEVAETVVIVLPNETILHPGGAVFLYTSGWVR